MSRIDDLSERSTQPPRWQAVRRRRRRRRETGARRSLTTRVLTWASVVLIVVLVAGTLAAYAKYRAVWTSIKRVRISTSDLGPRPPTYTNALNILLVGSDSRAGPNARFGAQVQGQRSDTVLLLHISPGRQQAAVLSVPRDSVVPVLRCQPEPGFGGQQAQPGQVEQVNSTFAFGGPGCLWKTIEYTTRIHIDHFMELNFRGFEKVINDIGGVNICLPFAVNDPRSRLHLGRGLHHVMGAQALAFWRVRYIGEGSDLQRIQRDQYLMAATAQGVERSGLLTSPAKLYSVITDAARAMSTDSGLSLSTMIRIAGSLKQMSAGSVQFVQVPSVYYPPYPNWVQWRRPQATRLFAAIAHDRTLPRVARQKARGTLPSLAAVSASRVRVQVLNGSGISGIAGQAAASLAGRGFIVVGTGDASAFRYSQSVISYGAPSDLPAARTLKAQLRNVVVRRDRALAAGTLRLIVGSGYAGLSSRPAPSVTPASSGPAPASSPPTPATSPPSPVRHLASSYNGITGAANVCRDSAAFSGPDGGF